MRAGRGIHASTAEPFIPPPPPYLRVPKATDVWIKVKEDSLECPRQGDSSDQQHNQHDVWERGSEINHLGGAGRDQCERAARARAHSASQEHSTDPQAGRDGQGSGQAAVLSTLLSPAAERKAFSNALRKLMTCHCMSGARGNPSSPRRHPDLSQAVSRWESEWVY